MKTEVCIECEGHNPECEHCLGLGEVDWISQITGNTTELNNLMTWTEFHNSVIRKAEFILSKYKYAIHIHTKLESFFQYLIRKNLAYDYNCTFKDDKGNYINKDDIRYPVKNATIFIKRSKALNYIQIDLKVA